MRNTQNKFLNPSVFGDGEEEGAQPYLEIIARLEAATEGTIELSAEIARDIMGHVPHDWPFWFRGPSFDGRDDAIVPVVPYTTSIDAAMTLLPEWASFNLMRAAAGPPTFTRAILWDWRRSPKMSDPGNEWKSEGNRPLPINVCIVALKARAASPANVAPHKEAPDES